MSAVPGRDLHVEFVLVDEETNRIPTVGASPTAQLSIGGAPFVRVDFPINEIGEGFYSFVVPGKYVGGEYPISVLVEADGTAHWRDIIQMQEFATEGGDLFEPEPLPDVEEAEPDDEWGEDILHNALWQFNDKSAGGSLTHHDSVPGGGLIRIGNKWTVTLGPDNGRTRQLYTTVPVQSGEYGMQIIGSATGDYNLMPSVLMHGAPYESLTDPTPLPEIQLRPDMDAILDFELEPYDPARVRIIFPNIIPEGAVFTFESITLRKKR